MDKKKYLGFECRQMSNYIHRCLTQRLNDAGFDEVTTMHGWIMGFLYANRDKDIYQKDIETHFEISRSTVTNILQLMEKKGYLTRTSVENDARLKRLELTELGIKTHLAVVDVIDEFNEIMEQGITDEESEIFFGVFAKMKDNISNTNTKKEEK